MVSPSQYYGTGLYMIQHPTVPSEQAVSFYFWDGAAYKMQTLVTAPVVDSELELAMSKSSGTVSTTLKDTGELEYVRVVPGLPNGQTTIKYTLFPNYSISRVPDYRPSMHGFYETGDRNGDGQADFRMIYSNGYEQLFFVVNSQ